MGSLSKGSKDWQNRGASGLGTNFAVVVLLCVPCRASCGHSGLHGAEALLQAMAVCASVFSIFQLILN